MAEAPVPAAGDGFDANPREIVTYQQVFREMMEGQFSAFQMKYSFEQIITYHLGDDEDLAQALNTHCKVMLKRGMTYKITGPMTLTSCFYLIGNGATLEIDTTASYVFAINNSLSGPMIGGMSYPTFDGVIFSGTPDNDGHLIFSTSQISVFGCTFLNFKRTCIRTTTMVDVTACMFAGCDRCIRADGDYPISIKQCTFKSCLICIAAKCDFLINGCASEDCFSFLLTTGSGRICNNSICSAAVPQLERFRETNLITCFGGTTVTLCSVHLVSNSSKHFPSFQHNIMYRSKIYVGFRKGTFHPIHCSFQYSHICLDPNADGKLSLNGSSLVTSHVSKILRFEDSNPSFTKCECGVTHSVPLPLLLSITDEVRPNPRVYSCHALEFESDEED